MTTTKSKRLKAIQIFINENWESSDKEGLLMEILEEHLTSDQLHQLMVDQDMGELIFK